ncbi:hypothetical protein K504DRAFT_495506 [Pleomassaria siparia CBS 279.74]|uniref:Uncharacterized protein n=1 Tax=Pleomassaria siparia CBS 279.74 TaxID=1314801 RepID=A0A6G1JT18_9PLEO|nr:hypothetical protein K504DRAFT_495506 [Pleomassaria siparia CBS 279.74]
MFSRRIILAVSLSSILFPAVLSSPTPLNHPKTIRVRQADSATSQSSACGAIYDALNDGYAYHYAIDAYACLISVPFNGAVATRFIKYVNETIQFQSTLAYLKDPPTGYQQPAVDVLSELSKIQFNVTNNIYQNQYQFEVDVQHLLFKAHDAHLYFSGGITSAFTFQAPYAITAASPDGKSLPKIYITNDVIESRDQGWTPSPIKTINNEDAVEYLTKFANLNAVGGIEPHADWNQLFDTPALYTQGRGSIWETSVSFYPGDEISLVMDNGTEYFDNWFALWNRPYQTGPLTTGGDFYNYFVLGLIPASYNASEGGYNPAYTPPIGHRVAPTPDYSWRNVTNRAYPDPDVQQALLGVSTEGILSGYFLPDADAAVLSIPSFGQYAWGIGNFSDTVSNFIDEATDANLTRLVIDLQQNTGGVVELAFSTFRRFFPDVEPFAGSRRRNHHLGDILGEAYTTYFDGLNPADADTQYNDTLADEWVMTPRLNAASGQSFSSWAEYIGPVQFNGDSFSLTERFNLSSYNYSLALFDGWAPLGYAPEAPLDYTQPPFKAENIVLLTDGACSSACALLVEMFLQVGVKTVTAGGRPVNGPMQAVGGTRGAVIYSADQIDYHLLNLGSPAFGLNDTTLATVPQLTESGFRDPGVYTAVLAVNLRDQVRPNDTTPLQFKYEAADCRIFYTLDNVYNMSRLWRDTVTAAFEDSSVCVEDSTGYTNFTKDAPQPLLNVPYSVDLDFGGPDSVVVAGDLNLSGGPQAGLPAWSNTVQPCVTIHTEYKTFHICSQSNKFCEDVQARPCSDPSAPLVDAIACVPHTTMESECPPGTDFITLEHAIFRLPSTRLSHSLGSGSSKAVLNGACFPNRSFTDLCQPGV